MFSLYFSFKVSMHALIITQSCKCSETLYELLENGDQVNELYHQILLRITKNTLPCSCLVFSTAAQAALHSCNSGEGIKPAEPAELSFLACHQ